jgi:glutathione S-transferase
MKLYYSPGACSLSPHIVLREAGLPFELVQASTKTKLLADGTDYNQINPKGQVPVLELNNGQRLTEGPVIVQYLADLAAPWRATA